MKVDIFTRLNPFSRCYSCSKYVIHFTIFPFLHSALPSPSCQFIKNSFWRWQSNSKLGWWSHSMTTLKKKLLSLFVYIVYIHLRQFPWKSCLGRQKLVLMFEQRKCRRHRYVLEHYKDFDICWSGWESDNSRHDFNICIREGGVHISTV